VPQCAGLHQKQDCLRLTVRTSSRVNSRTFMYISPFEAYRWRTDTGPPVSEKRLLLYAHSDSIADVCCNNEVSFCPFTSYHHSLLLFSTAGSKPAIHSHAHCQNTCSLTCSFGTVELISDRFYCLSTMMQLRTVATDNSHLSCWIQNKGGIFNSTVM